MPKEALFTIVNCEVGPRNGKVIVLDVDGILTELLKTRSWLLLTELISAPGYKGLNMAFHIFTYLKFLRGEIDAKEMSHIIAKTWQRGEQKANTKSVELAVAEILENHMIQDLETTIEKLKALGYQVTIASGSFLQFIEPLAEKLGIEHYLAAYELMFDEAETLVGFKQNWNDKNRAIIALAEKIIGVNFDPKQIVVIDDELNDELAQFASVTLSSLLKKYEDLAWATVNSVTNLPDLLTSLSKDN